jgi:hypothetical protein
VRILISPLCVVIFMLRIYNGPPPMAYSSKDLNDFYCRQGLFVHLAYFKQLIGENDVILH